jgi:hypothetical protein
MLDESHYDQQRRTRFYKAARQFAERLQSLTTVQEVVLCGSMATLDPYPLDLDLAVVLSSLAELPQIARRARQISSYYHGWEVFVFTLDRNYLGRLCHRKDCPTTTASCEAPDCGKIPYLGNLSGFEFNPELFLAPDLEVLWARTEKSILLDWRTALRLKPPVIEPLTPVEIECIECGMTFPFSVAEQKIYAKRGWHRPKRCEPCRQVRWR